MNQQARLVPLIIVGVGGIGRTLLRQMRMQRNHLRSTYGIELPIVALADVGSMVAGDPVLDDDTIDAVIEHGLSGASGYRGSPEDEQIAVISSLHERGFDKAIVVDATASDHTIPVLLEAAELGHDLVLANKRPLSAGMDVWYELMAAKKRGQAIRYEATVGAGLPVIGTLSGLVDSGDEIVSIEACLSGTLNYLCTSLEDGQQFSQAVRSARCQGITEPDPRDDLCGLDVARKALILTRMTGKRAELSDVARENLVPEHLMSASVDEFLASLESLDTSMSARQHNAVEQGMVLRYVAEIRGSTSRVALAQVPVNTPLGRLRGTDNMLHFRTARYSERTMVIVGPGAGRDVTAGGVFADILSIATMSRC